jgi:hypothetical protein
MHYDFIEIGTFSHDTLLDKAQKHARGLVVEHMIEYLDKLPEFTNVRKVYTAIVPLSIIPSSCVLDIYYIPADVIKANGLKHWMAQCNSVGKPHPLHKPHMNLVQIRKVPCMTYMDLLRVHEVTGLSYLKIDAEGYDCSILSDMLKYTPPVKHPNLILFETNEPRRSEEYVNTFRALCKAGYTIEVQEDNNTKAVKVR